MNKLSLKWRWRMLAAGMLLLAFLAYKFNFRKTLDVLGNYEEFKRKASIIPDDLARNESKVLQGPDLKLLEGNENVHFIKDISEYCDLNNIKLLGLNQDVYRSKDSLTVETSKIELEAPYEEILKFLSHFEYGSSSMAFNSVSIELLKNKIDGKHSLITTVYFKNVRHEK